MAKYKINAGYSEARTVEAESYRVEGDFIHFTDGEGSRVLTLRASQVYVIERE
ncbi:hypothetical protein ACIQOV_37360 [Kitasatospora sp. NPDC091257]|uniref:hypothetical protein n=1 Tax=Kitasatospora sp. NPDC091257 TaxID=3364084 RepID=UPI003812CAA2